MEGGTTFHFVTDGIHAALAQARAAAHGRDVRIGGGVAVIRQYLEAGLVDEIHLAISPALLGTGEALLAGLDLRRLGFEATRRRTCPMKASRGSRSPSTTSASRPRRRSSPRLRSAAR